MLEIIISVLILAIAVLPLFSLMTKQTSSTDNIAAEAYAINKATEVLNTFLENVPFAAIRHGNPGFIQSDDITKIAKFARYDENWAKKISMMLFNHSDKQGGGYPCVGKIKDARGTTYLVHLRVEDICSSEKPARPERIQVGTSFPDGSPAEFPAINELSFSYLRNPSILNDGSWMETYARRIDDPNQPTTELDLVVGVSEAPNSLYNDMGGVSTTFSYLNPTAERYFPKMVTQRVPYKADDSFAWCSMKRLVVQVQWNNDRKHLEEPEVETTGTNRIHLMTLKGDLD